MSLYYPSPRPHNKHSNFQLQFLTLCRLQQLDVIAGVFVVLSLLLAALAVIFGICLMIQPTTEAIQCPEECRCEWEGYLVDCSNSRLNSIPSILPTHVRQLVLDGNDISVFENDGFVSRGLVDLERIDAVFCKIRKIELGAFNGLTILKYLSLENNEISEIIPGIFETISSLEFLYLGNNIIKHLESDVFSGLVNLKNLSLEGNKLQYLHPDTFLALPNLQGLYLSKIAGLQIPTDRKFIKSHSLKHLDISGCSVSSVSVETFAKVSALERLDLSYNNLKSLDVNILKVLPELSVLYLFGNPLQCEDGMQEVWRWCQDHDIQTAYKEIAPECDTPSEVGGMWWGVLEKGHCLRDNIHYYGDYKNTTYSYTHIEDMDTNTNADTDTETKQGKDISSFLKQYGLTLSAILFTFGTTGNVIIIIIIIRDKDMPPLPLMYFFNLAISETIYLTAFFSNALLDSVTWLRGDIMCKFFPFCFRMSVGLTAYSIAVFSFQLYRLSVNPLHVLGSSQPTWIATGVWIAAAFFAIPAAQSEYICVNPILLWRTEYYEDVLTFQFFVSCLLPLSVISFSFVMTWQVESSSSLSEETQDLRLDKRDYIGRSLFCCFLVFTITSVPYHVYESIPYFNMSFDFSSFKFFIVSDYILRDIIFNLHILLSIKSCISTVALFCTSLAFRRHFKRYSTCCCKTNPPPLPPNNFELTKIN